MLSYLYSAFSKVMFVILIIALWDAQVIPNGTGGTTSISILATQFKLVGQWFLAKNLYPFLSYDLLLTISQFALFVVSIKLIIWIFAPGVSNTSGGGNDSNDTGLQGSYSVNDVNS